MEYLQDEASECKTEGKRNAKGGVARKERIKLRFFFLFYSSAIKRVVIDSTW